MSAPASTSHLVFLGTYTKNGSRGIYAARLDAATGALAAPTLVAETPDPAWITLSPDRTFLYAIHPSKAPAPGYAPSSVHGTGPTRFSRSRRGIPNSPRTTSGSKLSPPLSSGNSSWWLWRPCSARLQIRAPQC